MAEEVEEEEEKVGEGEDVSARDAGVGVAGLERVEALDELYGEGECAVRLRATFGDKSFTLSIWPFSLPLPLACAW